MLPFTPGGSSVRLLQAYELRRALSHNLISVSAHLKSFPYRIFDLANKFFFLFLFFVFSFGYFSLFLHRTDAGQLENCTAPARPGPRPSLRGTGVALRTRYTKCRRYASVRDGPSAGVASSGLPRRQQEPWRDLGACLRHHHPLRPQGQLRGIGHSLKIILIFFFDFFLILRSSQQKEK